MLPRSNKVGPAAVVSFAFQTFEITGHLSVESGETRKLNS